MEHKALSNSTERLYDISIPQVSPWNSKVKNKERGGGREDLGRAFPGNSRDDALSLSLSTLPARLVFVPAIYHAYRSYWRRSPTDHRGAWARDRQTAHTVSFT